VLDFEGELVVKTIVIILYHYDHFNVVAEWYTWRSDFYFVSDTIDVACLDKNKGYSCEVHIFSLIRAQRLGDRVLENRSSSCYNCDQWRVRKMRGGWKSSEGGVLRSELRRTVKSCHAWLWSWLTVGPLRFTDPLTACLVVFQGENRSRCRRHQKITSPKLSPSVSYDGPQAWLPPLLCPWPMWLQLHSQICTDAW